MVPSRDDGVRQMRVLMVEPIGGHRGMHYYDFELCEALRQAGIDVTLLTCDETVQVSVPPLLRIGYPFQCIYGDLPKAVRGLHYVRGLISTLRTAKQQHAQIIHFHFPHIPVIDYLYLVLAKQLGVGIVLTVHDVIPFNAKSSDHRWLRIVHGDRLGTGCYVAISIGGCPYARNRILLRAGPRGNIVCIRDGNWWASTGSCSCTRV